MALTDENSMVMPVQPMYGGYGNNGGGIGFGGDWAWILLLLVLGGGWGGFGGFGMGGMMGGAMLGADMGGWGLYPWLNNSQNINDGFRDAQLHDSVTSVRDGISALSTQLCNCCGDMQLGMANGFNSVNNSIFGAQAAISQQLNTNELASLNRSFAEQTANTQGFTNVQAQLAQNGYNQAIGTADLKYTIATENCADRYEAAQNTRDIVDAIRSGDQMIMDKLCALELDTVKSQLAQAQRENVSLQNAVNMASMQASQVAQTAELRASQAQTANQLVSELRSCPIPSQPVYGNQPIFTCAQNVANSGCGCSGNF
ncbi:hypothetical protein [Ruminococcus flavefaciens]|uniref:hypothetical protein n=1 Tax=Ruminococcus flavefaciens TaxID=1265 RepID=UPI0026EDA788|nr:hypothetical protein [Ruminococcus flavefaciens]